MIGLFFNRVVKPSYVGARRLLGRALFEGRYQVQTEGVLTRTELGISDLRYMHYAPSGVRSLLRILPRREVTPDDVFIDLGSGKGRVVLQAALHYPFRRVYGVELSEPLHVIAQHNLDVCRSRLRCRDVRLTQANVLDYEIPEDVTVVYLYNPFLGDVFRTVVERLLDSLDRHPRPLRIIYGNPVEEEALLSSGRVRPVRTVRGWRPGAEWSRSNSFRLYTVT